MTKTRHSSLRARLRTDTQVSHDALDRAVSEFDLTTATGLQRFLWMQCTALQAIAPHAAQSTGSEMIADLVERTTSDLSAIGATGDLVGARIGPLHPLAIDYVIAGSRLGTQVLKKRWQAATDPVVRRMDAYFSAPSYIEVWKSFCAASETMPATGPEADKIVGDADLMFKLYQTCTQAPDKMKAAIHA